MNTVLKQSTSMLTFRSGKEAMIDTNHASIDFASAAGSDLEVVSEEEVLEIAAQQGGIVSMTGAPWLITLNSPGGR